MANVSSLRHEISPSPPTMPRFLETESSDGIRERLSRLVLDGKADGAPNASSNIDAGTGSLTNEKNSVHSQPVAFSPEAMRAVENYVKGELLHADINVVTWHLRYDKGPVGVYLRNYARKLEDNGNRCLFAFSKELDDQNSEHGKGLSLKTDKMPSPSFLDRALFRRNMDEMRSAEEYIWSLLSAGDARKLSLLSKHDEGPVGEYLRFLLQQSGD